MLDDAEVRPGLLRGLLERLETFLEPFVRSLCCCEQRTNARHYVSGLLSDLQSKDAESIADLLSGGAQTRLSRRVGESGWREEKRIWRAAYDRLARFEAEAMTFSGMTRG